MPDPLLWLTLAWYALWNAAAFITFLRDKRAARRGARRTSERTLMTLTALGGFVGAWLAMRAARHKIRKPLFRLVPPAAALLHAAGWITLALSLS